MTTVTIPDMNCAPGLSSTPATSSPGHIQQARHHQHVPGSRPSSTASAATANSAAHQAPLPQTRHLHAGAPPPPPQRCCQLSKCSTPTAQIFTPYGAPGLSPVSTIGSHEIPAETSRPHRTRTARRLHRPASSTTSKSASSKITRHLHSQPGQPLELPTGEIGEITVQGPAVTPGAL